MSDEAWHPEADPAVFEAIEKHINDTFGEELFAFFDGEELLIRNQTKTIWLKLDGGCSGAASSGPASAP